MLRDTAGLARSDIRLADVVQQRRLTVVDVSHDRYDRRTRNQLLLAVLDSLDSLLYLDRDEFDLEAELLRHDHQSLGVETLVDRDHKAEIHAGRDDLHRRDVHHGSQLAHGNELRHAQYRALHLFALHLLVELLAHLLALLLAVLRALGLSALGGKTSQRILDLLLYLLVAHFGADDRLGLVLLVLELLGIALTLSRLSLAGTASLGIAAASRLLLALAAVLRLVDVDLLLVQTLALVLAARDHVRHVHSTDDLRSAQLRGIGTEDVVLRSLRLGLLLGFRGLGCRSGSRCRRRRCGRRYWLGRLPDDIGRFVGCNGLVGDRALRRGLRRLRLLCRCGSGLLGRLLGRLGRLLSAAAAAVEIDLAEEFGRRYLVLYADYVAFDDYLLVLLGARLLRGNAYCGLFLRYAFTHGVALVTRDAITAELLLQHGIDLGRNQRAGRTVALDALLLEKIGDRIESHLELLGNLYKS